MADDRIPPTEAAHADVHHEQSDVDVRAILWWAVGLVVFAIVAHVGVYAHFAVMRKMERNPDLLPVSMVKQQGPKLPPAPRLQPFPSPGEDGRAASPLRNRPPRDMAEMRRDQQKYLASYGWVNEATKTAHIPIDRAIELQLQKGFPVAAGGQPQPPAIDGPAQPVPAPDMTQPSSATAPPPAPRTP